MSRFSLGWGRLCAWASLVMGLLAWANWVLLYLVPIRGVGDNSTVSFVKTNQSFLMSCCGVFLLPILGVTLGIGGLRTAGYSRPVARIGIILSVASGVTLVVLISYIIWFGSLPVG